MPRPFCFRIEWKGEQRECIAKIIYTLGMRKKKMFLLLVVVAVVRGGRKLDTRRLHAILMNLTRSRRAIYIWFIWWKNVCEHFALHS